MAIVNNTFSANGDELIIKNAPIIGVVNLVSFTDVTIGVNVNKGFSKEFRLSVNNGIIFTDFLPLTNSNLSTFNWANPVVVWIELRYTRAGIDATGLIELVSVNINATYAPIIDSGFDATKKSIYRDIYFYDSNVLELTKNILEKIYYTNAYVPKYIKRGGGNDKQFIDFWDAAAKMAAMYIVILQSLRGINNDAEYMKEYLRQRGLFFDANSLQLFDVALMRDTLYKRFMQRGSERVFTKKSSSEPLNGEYLQLIAYEPLNELLYGNLEGGSVGWSLLNSSPMQIGVNRNRKFDKSYEKINGANSLSNYPLINPSFCSIVTVGGRDCIEVNSPTFGFISGVFGAVTAAFSSDKSKLIPIDNTVDYELSFAVRQENIVDGRISFGFTSFDKDFNQVLSRDLSGVLANNAAFNIALPLDNTFYYVKVVIFNKNKSYSSNQYDFNTNLLGNTKNLIFNEKAQYIIPFIMLTRANNNVNPIKAQITDICLTPLVYGKTLNTAQSIGYLGGNNVMFIYSKNNNQFEPAEKIEDITKKNLLPYSVSLNPIWL